MFNQNLLLKFKNYEKSIISFRGYIYLHNINALGSGYTSGTITIQCAKNSDGLTTEELYSKLTVGEASEINIEIFHTDELYTRQNDENKWNHDVIVYGDNMSLDTGIKNTF